MGADRLPGGHRGVAADLWPTLGRGRPEKRGQAIGRNAVAVSLGVAAGPSLGGIITEHLTWRWIFFLNVPIGIAGAVLAWRLLDSGHGRPQKFDFVGAALLGVGLGLLTLGLSFATDWGWPALGLIGVGLAALVWLVRVERQVAQPNLDLALLRCRPFAFPVISLVLSFLGLFAVGFLMPFYFENLRQFSPQTSGFLLTPLAIAVAVAAPFSGSLADRIGSRWLASFGPLVACVQTWRSSRVLQVINWQHCKANS